MATGSLIVTEYLAALYRRVPLNPHREEPTGTFWGYVFKQHWYYGPEFAQAFEAPPGKDTSKDISRRRKDSICMSFQQLNFQLFPIVVCEWKNAVANPQQIKVMEKQMLDGCMDYLTEGVFDIIYGFTAYGTNARFWKVTPDSCVAFTDHYIEANSEEGYILSRNAETTKAHPPTQRVGQDYSQVGSSQTLASPLAISGYETSVTAGLGSVADEGTWRWNFQEETYEYIIQGQVEHSQAQFPLGRWVHNFQGWDETTQQWKFWNGGSVQYR